MTMGSNTLFSVSGKFYTLDGAASLLSCGSSSAKKGVSVAFSGLADAPDRMNIWYLRAPGDSATMDLHFRDIVDIRTCALNESAAQNAVRMTGKNGELYILEMKSSALSQNLANKLCAIGKEFLDANRDMAKQLSFPEQGAQESSAAFAERVMVPTAAAAAAAPERKKKFLHVLGIVLQTIGYLLLFGMVGAFFNDSGHTDWTGAGVGLVALITLVVVGTVLTKKN
jgi:hypothetical protein